jgi:hypothetical protein
MNQPYLPQNDITLNYSKMWFYWPYLQPQHEEHHNEDKEQAQADYGITN